MRRPEPLRFVQRFVNTIDLSHDREWLTAFLAEEGLDAPTDAELDRARGLRESIRELLYANNGQGRPAERWEALNGAASAGEAHGRLRDAGRSSRRRRASTESSAGSR